MSERMEALYERARAMAPEARARFLAEACGGDSRLEQELASLLEHAEPAEAFFAGLAHAIVPPAVGHRVGHYQLLGVLGSGGMGTVYRARDTRLDREVALKFLPLYRSAELEARERLLVEARAAAALDHPNVCKVHEIGETSDGAPFIAMACYEGETLRERLRRGPLTPEHARETAVQLARGISAAHARGIVHRDVKPGNIMLCTDGMVRLLDFGLAKVADASLTGPGVTPGTVAYMSPEHARGDPVDARTDLWSLGVVLYEILSGVRPFRGGNDHAVVQAILHEQPEPLHRRVPDAPAALGRVVDRLLQKSATERYGSADELLEDLGRDAPAGAEDKVRGWVHSHARVLAMSGAGLLAVVLLASLARQASRPASALPPDGAPPQPAAIAVLPFTVRGPDLEVWREGMVDLLAMGLDGTAGIRAIDSRTLLARWHQEVGDASVADLDQALGVARRAQARYALIGSAIAAGPLIRLRADIYDVESGLAVAPVQVQGPSDSMLALVDRLGIQALGHLLAKRLGDVPALDLARITTPSLIALRHYLEGEARYRHGEFRNASAAWERAVRADTLFSLAYYRLAESYGWHAENDAAYGANLERAAKQADRLPELQRMLLQVRATRFAGSGGALSMMREAVSKYPDAAEAWHELGEIYHHDPDAMGAPGDAERAFRRAMELQPTMAAYATHLLELVFRWHPDSTSIARELESYIRLAPHGEWTEAGRVALALAFGGANARAEAEAELARLDQPSVINAYRFLGHPRFSEVREAVFGASSTPLDRHSLGLLRNQRALNVALMDGRASDGLRILDDGGLRDGVFYCGPLYLAERGLPVPDRVLEGRLAASRGDSTLFESPDPVMCAAMLAAQQGSWSEHSALLTRARTITARELAAGNRVSASAWNRAILSAEAHGHWRRGRTEEALDAFERTLAARAGRSLWQVGLLNLELGRLDRAERAFRADLKRDGTPAYLQLARILERNSRPAEAREAYEFVAYAWRHADSGLQPAVEEARRGAARLSAQR